MDQMSPVSRAQKKKTRKKNQESSSSSSSLSSLILTLPEDLLMNCIARVPKQNYRNLSRVCKLFRFIVTSPDLFATRSFLKCTESCIYVSILDRNRKYIRWYNLIRDNENDNKLVPVTSLPRMPCCERYVAIGSKIFVIGGGYNKEWKSDVSVIDCRFDVAKSLSKMPELVSDPIVSDVFDGKIYVFGGYYGSENKTKRSRKRKRETGKPEENKMLVLDTQVENWEYDTRSGLVEGGRVVKTVALDSGKIYVEGFEKDFVFDPKEGQCDNDLLADNDYDLTSLYSILSVGKGCVIDEILYTFDKYCLKAYDLKRKLYRGDVKGVDGLDKYHDYKASAFSCSNKKMILFFHNGCYSRAGSRKFFCAEISLTENETGEIWGKVEWCQMLYKGHGSFIDCVTVTV